MAAYGFTIDVDGNSVQVITQITQALQRLGVTATLQMGKLGGEVTGTFSGIAKSFSQLKGLLVGGLGLAAGFGGLKKFFNLGTEMEQTNVAFEVMLGSGEKAKVMISQLQAFAAKTNFKTGDVSQAAELMMNFGIESKNVLPYLQMLGDASGGNTERFRTMALAFSQISSAGKLTGQDLLQLINAGFNPLQYMAKTTGKDVTTLRKEMEKGNITFNKVVGAFKSATAEGGKFHGMMDKQSQTVGGKWSTLMDTFEIKLIQLFDALSPFFSKVIDGINATVNKIINVFTSTSSAARIMRTIIMGVVAAWITYTVITKAAAAITAIQAWWQAAGTTVMFINALAIEGVAGAWAVLNGAMLANPIVWIVGLVVGLIVVIMMLWDKFKGFREFLGGFFAFWKQIFFALGHAVVNYAQVVDDVIHLRLKKALTDGKKMVTDFKDDLTTGMVDSVKKGAEAAGNSKFKFGDLLKFGTGQQGPSDEFGKDGADGKKKGNSNVRDNAFSTSNLAGGKGGLGEAKIINIRIDTMQRVTVNDGAGWRNTSQDAIEVLTRTINNLAYSQSATQ